MMVAEATQVSNGSMTQRTRRKISASGCDHRHAADEEVGAVAIAVHGGADIGDKLTLPFGGISGIALESAFRRGQLGALPRRQFAPGFQGAQGFPPFQQFNIGIIPLQVDLDAGGTAVGADQHLGVDGAGEEFFTHKLPVDTGFGQGWHS
jgi:hypothetical protein